VFADDWGRHPSSCQHLVGKLLDRHGVWWVNTIGTRKPRLDVATFRRGFEKVRHWGANSRNGFELPTNLHVVNPRMWPWISRRADRWLNRKLLLRQLAPLVESLPRPVAAVTTLPIVADLMGPLPVDRWVYYCVDDFGQWPGLDQLPLREMEERVVRQADVVVAAGSTLQERLAQMGRESHLLTHGVELEYWRTNGHSTPVPQLAGLERPLVVFWGVIDRRMDLAFVQQLGEGLAKGTIVLAGPEADPDPALFRAKRVVRLGPLPFAQLPHLGHEADVLIMPYADLPVTRAMQPLKLKEYLATGKPAVVRDLPANRAWADCLDLAGTREEFTKAVQQRLVTGLPDEQRLARTRLGEESWGAKARQFEQWIFHG
jgi:glycosyltransferase involved in cell wall biosynthesis